MNKINILLLFIFSIIVSGCGSTSNAENNTSTAQQEPNIPKNPTSPENTTIPEEPTIPKKVACVGDSITEGYGLDEPIVNSYPAQLSKKLGKEWDVKNFGIRSATLIETGNRPYTDTPHYINSLNFEPNIVVIMLGTNDMKAQNIVEIERYVSDYASLISQYRNLPSKPLIYICTPPPSYGKMAGLTNDNIVHTLLPKIKKVSQENNVPLINIYDVLTNKKSLFPDTLHPDEKGAKIIADTVAKAINSKIK